MRKFKKIIFTFILTFMFVINIEAQTCIIGDYEFDVEPGNIKVKIISFSKPDIEEHIKERIDDGNMTVISEDVFVSSSGCPKEDEVEIKFSNDGRTMNLSKIDKKQSSTTPECTEEKCQDLGGCSGYTYKESCQGNDFYSCIWNKNQFGEYCNTDKLVYVRCGDSFDIPHEAPKIISFIIALLKVAIPIILIFVAVLSLLKAVGASNEDEIKKAQKSLVRKIASAVLAFFVITIVQFVIMKVADSAETNDISSCLSCFMNNDCDGVAYYKTNVGGTYLCTELGGSKSTFTCPGNS